MLLPATVAAAESVGCCPPARLSAPIRYLCSRRICRVLPTCSDRTKPSQSNAPPLQPQNLSGAAHLFDRPLLPTTFAAAESVGCCLPARPSAPARYRCSRRIRRVLPTCSDRTKPSRSYSRTVSVLPSAPARYLCRCRICRVLPTCSDRTKPSRSYSRTAPVFLTKTYKNSPAGAVSAITFCSTAVPMPLP